MRMRILAAAAFAAGVMTTAEAASGPASTGVAMKVAATYASGKPNERLAIFLSGDGGWNQGVVSMARAVASEGYVVAGVDFPKYLRARIAATTGPCIPLYADLLATAKAMAAPGRRGAPLLIGYSSGATGVYAALAEAGKGDFAGGVSLGFGPDLKTSKPFCMGDGLEGRPDKKLGFVYDPAPRMSAPWVVLQGEIDQVVSAEKAKVFVAKVPDARIVLLPKVGHGFSVEKNWMPQFREIVLEMERAAPPPMP